VNAPLDGVSLGMLKVGCVTLPLVASYCGANIEEQFIPRSGTVDTVTSRY
jgi:hypothetical protein